MDSPGKLGSNAQKFMFLHVSFPKPVSHLFVAPISPCCLIGRQGQDFSAATPLPNWFCGLKTQACCPGHTQDGEARGELAA
jgi:hypothetical protein